MPEYISQAIDQPLFVVGFIIGVFLCIIVAAVYVICSVMIHVLAPAEDDDVQKTPRARRAHKKERNRSGSRATTNAVNMVADGCLELPGR